MVTQTLFLGRYMASRKIGTSSPEPKPLQYYLLPTHCSYRAENIILEKDYGKQFIKERTRSKPIRLYYTPAPSGQRVYSHIQVGSGAVRATFYTFRIINTIHRNIFFCCGIRLFIHCWSIRHNNGEDLHGSSRAGNC